MNVMLRALSAPRAVWRGVACRSDASAFEVALSHAQYAYMRECSNVCKSLLFLGWVDMDMHGNKREELPVRKKKKE